MREAASKAEPLRSPFTPAGNHRRGPTETGSLGSLRKARPARGPPENRPGSPSTVLPPASAGMQDAGGVQRQCPGRRTPEGSDEGCGCRKSSCVRRAALLPHTSGRAVPPRQERRTARALRAGLARESALAGCSRNWQRRPKSVRRRLVAVAGGRGGSGRFTRGMAALLPEAGGPDQGHKAPRPRPPPSAALG